MMADTNQALLDALNEVMDQNILDYESVFRDLCNEETMLRNETYLQAINNMNREAGTLPQTESDWQNLFQEIEALVSNGFLWETEKEDYQISPQVLQSLFGVDKINTANTTTEIKIPLKMRSIDDKYFLEATVPDDLFPEQLNFKSVLFQLPERINAGYMKASFQNGSFRLELPSKEVFELSKFK
ncbi:MAG TPA: hypothetical protein GX404_05835 [Syntrophomonadaceae bacterium]|nr:hypothetical protein [Syntrophomonadaceae bacterium]